MDGSDVLAFVDRDWEAARLLKEKAWIEMQNARNFAERLRASEDLWLHARLLNPDGPSDEERQADLEHHAYLSRLLRSVPARPPTS